MSICTQCHLWKRVIAEPLNECSLSNRCVSHGDHGHLRGPRHPPPQPACHSPASQFSQLSGSHFSVNSTAINSVKQGRLLNCHQVHPEGSHRPQAGNISLRGRELEREIEERPLPLPPSQQAPVDCTSPRCPEPGQPDSSLPSLVHLASVLSTPSPPL